MPVGSNIKPKIQFLDHHTSRPMLHTSPLATDPFDAWQHATRVLLAVLSPRMPAVAVRIKLKDGGRIELPVDAPPPEPSSANTRQSLPELSAKQKRIMAALLAGPMKGETLATECEFANRSSLHSGRGIKQLMGWGLILNDETDGYTLTEFGEDVASEVAEG